MTMRAVRRIGALLIVAAVLPACDPFPGFFEPFPATTADMRGTQLVPSLATTSFGSAKLTFSGSQDIINYSVTFFGGPITSVTINVGAAGANGPALFTLTTTSFANPLTGKLTPADLSPAASHGVLNFSHAADRIRNGGAYIIVKTTNNTAGEVRGQLGAAVVASAILSGAQEVPPVASTGTGSATFQLDSTQTQITATVNVSGLAGITMAHLHFGATGVGGGPIIFDLSTTTFTSPLTVTLTSADFMAGGGLTTFADAVNALLSGLLYVNVHTGANPGGELRGQVGAAQLTAALSGANVVPANGSAATGTAIVSLNATQTAINVSLTHTVGTPTSVVIHADDPGVNGPQIFDADAVAGSPASPVNASLQSTHLIPQASKGVNTFPDAVNAVLTSRTYIDVGSTGFPAGEIRGQIVP